MISDKYDKYRGWSEIMAKLWVGFHFLSIDLWVVLRLVLLNVVCVSCLLYLNGRLIWEMPFCLKQLSWDEKCQQTFFSCFTCFPSSFISQFWYWNVFFLMQILVVFMGSEPVTVKIVRVIHGQVSSPVGLHGLILVLQSKMNHFAKKELATFPCTVETFPVSRSPFCCMMKYLRYKCELPGFGSS